MSSCCLEDLKQLDFKDVMVLKGDFGDETLTAVAEAISGLPNGPELIITLPNDQDIEMLDEAEMLTRGWVRADKELK